MKKMLHIGLGLMLVCGTAGAVNFMKMYRSGEINKIYEQPVAQQKVTAPHCNMPVKESMELSGEKKMTEPKNQTLHYTHKEAPQALATTEKQTLKEDAVISENSMTPNNNVADNVSEAEKIEDVAEVKGVGVDTSDLKTEKEGKEEVETFKLSMYSRGRIEPVRKSKVHVNKRDRDDKN
jgi:hypothetical protein